ncbi:YbaN family protein [Saccharospirillum mangrovi]|uniref:YbaN family protein n=1 Tax=Saccharospirillum mangrovi TaxID=2161747 RepID=UPI001E5665CD|nr:YbaN family protein [Saccharospirillum mangrovi]
MHRWLIRWTVFMAGWLCVGLGALGVVLPVLPTTPFMLLAAVCFARTSPRFHRWLLSSKLFGPLIDNWQRERYIEKRSKRVALIVVAVTFSLSIAVVDPWPLKIMLLCFWLGCTIGIGRLSTVPLSQRQATANAALAQRRPS